MDTSKTTTFVQTEHGIVLCVRCRDEQLTFLTRRGVDDIETWSDVDDPAAVCVACSYTAEHWGPTKA